MALFRPSKDKGSARLRHRAESLAAPLPALLVEAERVASTVAFGIHGRRRVGQGETFWQFRHYAQGDPRTAIDWRKSARAPSRDTLYVRDHEWEAAQSVYFAIDRTHSMAFSSDESQPTKEENAIVFGLALALLLIRAGERIAHLASDALPASGRAAYSRFAEDLTNTASQSSALATLHRRALPSHARVIFIGDFLHPLEESFSTIDHYVNLGADGLMVQINDPAEEEFPFTGRTRFERPEARDALVFGKAENLRADYRRLFFAHREALSGHAARVGWTFATHRTDHPLEAALLSAFLGLSGGRFGAAAASG